MFFGEPFLQQNTSITRSRSKSRTQELSIEIVAKDLRLAFILIVDRWNVSMLLSCVAASDEGLKTGLGLETDF